MCVYISICYTLPQTVSFGHHIFPDSQKNFLILLEIYFLMIMAQDFVLYDLFFPFQSFLMMSDRLRSTL